MVGRASASSESSWRLRSGPSTVIVRLVDTCLVSGVVYYLFLRGEGLGPAVTVVVFVLSCFDDSVDGRLVVVFEEEIGFGFLEDSL